MEYTPSKRRIIAAYGYIAVAFLLWENLIGSVVGFYHLELRRTIWGLVYYLVVFLLFGVLTEIGIFIIGKIIPSIRWYGIRYVWLTLILVTLLWGEAFREILVHITGTNFSKFNLIFILLWLPLILATGILTNILLKRKYTHPESRHNLRLIMYFSTALLYIIVAGKVTSKYYHEDVLNTVNLLLQPVLLSASFLVTFILSKLFSNVRSFRWALLLAPILATILVVGISAGFRSEKTYPRSPSRALTDHPNIVVLLFDALRSDHVGKIVDGASLTPTLDSLAHAGKSYPVCYSTASYTFTAIVSLFCSKLPNKLGLVRKKYITDGVSNLGNILKQNDYRTIGISSNSLISSLYGFDQFFDVLEHPVGVGPNQLLFPDNVSILSTKLVQELGYEMDFLSFGSIAESWQGINQRAIELIDEDLSKPFFLYCHYLEPHAPYFCEPFNNGILDLAMLSNLTKLEYVDDQSADHRSLIHDIIPEMHTRYMQGVSTVNRAVTEMLRYFMQSGLSDNTIFIIIADHGEEFFEHQGYDHWSTLYNETVRTQLIINIPERLGIDLPDSIASLSIMDIAPTILDLAGIDEEIPDCDGCSLLSDPSEPVRKQFMVLEPKSADNFWSAVVLLPYKLIFRENYETGMIDTMLFNLETDSGESTNLYPERNEIADSLAFLLQTQLDQSIEPAFEDTVTLPLEEQQRLRALGYVN